MGKIYEEITEKHQKLIAEQHMFFVGTVPGSGGHINVSPKGYAKDCFRVLSPLRVAYLDLTGSGSETIAHSRTDGRIVIMFLAFNQSPKILRLHGNATAIAKIDLSNEQLANFDGKVLNSLGLRALIQVDVTRISCACGYSVPNYQFISDRDILINWAKNMGEENVRKFRNCWNGYSIDGYPSIAHPLVNSDAPSFVVRRKKKGIWHCVTDWTVWEALTEVFRLPTGVLPVLSGTIIPSWRELIFGVTGALATVGLLRSDRFAWSNSSEVNECYERLKQQCICNI